jgi:uncharacterized protein YjiS (DUF1127 family)
VGFGTDVVRRSLEFSFSEVARAVARFHARDEAVRGLRELATEGLSELALTVDERRQERIGWGGVWPSAVLCGAVAVAVRLRSLAD